MHATTPITNQHSSPVYLAPENIVGKTNAAGQTVLHQLLTMQRPRMDVIEHVFDVWPQAAKLKDKTGVYPIELAFSKSAPLSLIEKIANQFPPAIKTASPATRETLLHKAVFRTCVPGLSEGVEKQIAVKILLQECPLAGFIEDSQQITPFDLAEKAGNEEISKLRIKVFFAFKFAVAQCDHSTTKTGLTGRKILYLINSYI